jgi:hypothetical protein
VRSPLRLLATSLVVASLVVACSSGPERSAAALCERLARTEGLDESLAVADADAIDQQAADLRRAVEVAPDDIEPALRTLSETVDAIASTVATATGDRRTAITETLADRQDGVDALTWSGVAVGEWSVVNCGLDLDTGASVPTTTPTTEVGAGGGDPPSTDAATPDG